MFRFIHASLGKALGAGVLALACLTPLTAALAAEVPLPGDINGDGAVTAADAAGILRAACGITSISDRERAQYDITGGNTFTDTDALAAQWLATGQIADYDAFTTVIHTGLCGEDAFPYFSYTGVQDRGNGSYRSEAVGVDIRRSEAYDTVYFLADIHVRDLRSLRTRFAGNAYFGGSELATTMAERCNAIVAVNGDYYSFRSSGPLVRNGETYRDHFSFSGDIGFLFKDGTFSTMTVGAARTTGLEQLDPYQTWLFGPSLLTDAGKAKTSFTSELTKANPRTVFGYYSPGHYAFLVADGRQKGYSVGLELKELAALCEELGMTAAYNLDGGQSSVMTSRYGLINRPPSITGRPVSDILYVSEPDAAYS